MKKALFILLAIGVFCANDALADWRNTRWGMTVKEIAEATGEYASTASENYVSEGGMKMFRRYIYDPNTKGLSAVAMQPAKREDCDKLVTALQAKYGPDSLPAIAPQWRKKSGSYTWDYDENSVVVFRVRADEDIFFGCTVVYEVKSKSTVTKSTLKDVL